MRQILNKKWLFSLALTAMMALGTVQAKTQPTPKQREALKKVEQAKAKVAQLKEQLDHARKMVEHYKNKTIKILGRRIPDPRAAAQAAVWMTRSKAVEAAYRVAMGALQAASRVLKQELTRRLVHPAQEKLRRAKAAFDRAMQKFRSVRAEMDKARQMVEHYKNKFIKVFGKKIPDPKAVAQLGVWKARHAAAQAAYKIAYAAAKAAYDVYRNLKA